MVKHSKVDGTKTKSRVGLIVMLAMLVVAIVALVVGIVVTNIEHTKKDDTIVDYEGVRGGGLQALAINEEIISRIDTDESYSIEDAIEEYERETSFGNTEKRVYLLFDYANFIYDKYGDIETATEIAQRAERLLNSKSMTADYYIAMAALYEKAGYVEQAELYNKKLMDVTPNVNPDLIGSEDIESNINGGDE